MSSVAQRYLLIGLGGVWLLLILMRFSTVEPVQEVPLQFRSGVSPAKSRQSSGAMDLWTIRPLSTQAKSMSEDPKKNIFAPLGATTAVSMEQVVMKVKRAAQSGPVGPQSVVAVAPVASPGPTPEELAARQEEEQRQRLAREQEDLKRRLAQEEEANRKQLREQMGQFRYLGYLSQQGVHKAFLGRGKDIYIIRKGDKLDGKFLVASIEPATVKLKEPTTSLETLLELTKEGDRGPS